MKFVLEIKCVGEAFGKDEFSRNIEVSYILDNISRQIEDGKVFGNVKDTEGNTVGHYHYVDSE